MTIQPAHADLPYRYGGLGQRFAALLTDFLIFCAVFFPITRLVKGVWLMKPKDHLWDYGWMITDPLCIAFLAAMFAYFVICESAAGATIGKRLMRLRVVRLNGQPPGLTASFVRNVLRIIDGLPALNILGVVLILTSPQRARFGDRVAGTRVIIRQ